MGEDNNLESNTESQEGDSPTKDESNTEEVDIEKFSEQWRIIMPIRRDNLLQKNTSTTEDELRSLGEVFGFDYTLSIDIERIDNNLIRNLSLTLAREQGFYPCGEKEKFTTITSR